MEHRWSSRYPAVIDVQLRQQDRPIVWCKTRDVSIDGMFLDTGPLFFRPHTLLNLEFGVEVSRRFRRSRKYRVPVTVVHNSNEGIGLMIMKADPETYYAWQQVMTRARYHSKRVV